MKIIKVVLVLMMLALGVMIDAEDKVIDFQTGTKGDFYALGGKIKFYRNLKENKAYYTHPFTLTIAGKPVALFSSPVFFPGYRVCRRIEDKTIDVGNKSVVDEGVTPNSDLGYIRDVKARAGGLFVDVRVNDKAFWREAERATLYCWLNIGDVVKAGLTINGKPVLLPDVPKEIIRESKKNILKTLRMSINDTYDLGLVFIAGFARKNVYLQEEKKGKITSPSGKRIRVDLKMENSKGKYFIAVLRKEEKLPGVEDILNAEVTRHRREVVKGNLINQGSGFETGPFDGFSAFARSTGRDPNASLPKSQPVIDPTTQVSGKNSLRLPLDQNSAVIFNRVKFTMNHPYTFSVWMKSDKPVVVWYGVGMPNCPPGHPFNKRDGHVFIQKAKLTPTWKRYSISFTPAECRSRGYWPMGVGIRKRDNKTIEDAMVWVDDFQLEEGELTDYVPPEKLGMGAAVLDKYRLVRLGEKATVNLYFRNNTGKVISGAVEYILKDYWERTVKDGKTGNLTIPALGNFATKIELGELQRGYYRCYFKGPEGAVEECVFGVYEPQTLTKVSAQWPFAKHLPDADPIARELGFGWCRVFNFFEFHYTYCDDGTFDFTETDKILKNAEETGMNLMPVLDCLARERKFARYRPGQKVPSYLTRFFTSPSTGRKMGICSIENWKKYVKAVVGRYKNRIDYWEIMNEPNGLEPKVYLEYLKAAYEAAKEVNPNSVIIGFSATSDMAGKPLPWSKKIIELGGWKYLDAISLHMYGKHAPENYHELGEDKIMRILIGLCAGYGKKNVTIWNTEKNSGAFNTGYSTRKFNVPIDYHYKMVRCAGDFKTKGEYFIREGLITSNVGRAPFFWHTELVNQLYSSTHANMTYLHGPQYTEFDMAPRPELIAVNAIASLMIDKVSSAGEVDWGGINRCYLYNTPKGLLVALWNWKNGAIARIPVENISCEFLDYFANPIEKKMDENGRLVVELDSAPKYLLLPETDSEQCRRIMTGTILEGIDNLSVSSQLKVIDNDQLALAVKIRNQVPTPWEGKIQVKELPTDWKVSQVDWPVKIDGNTEREVVIPVTCGDSLDVHEKIVLAVNGRLVELLVLEYQSLNALKDSLSPVSKAVAGYARPGSIKIDGDLADWESFPISYISTYDNLEWKGPLDASVKLRLAWNKDNLYFAVRVFDDNISSKHEEKTLWSNDSIELFLDLSDGDRDSDMNSSKTGYILNDDDFHGTVAIGAGVKNTKAVAKWKYMKDDGGTVLASKRIKDGYIIEGAIPWKSFNRRCAFAPQAGKEVGFTFILNDVDNLFRKRMIWVGDQGVNKSPKTWGRLTFEQ